jgi:hypothetical protein
MSAARRGVINLLLACLVAGSLYDIATDQEHWPFSQYPMFSGIWRATTFKWHRLVGVLTDGREWTIEDTQYIFPFDNSRLHLAIVRIALRPDAERKLADAVANCLERYERRRRAGQHDGPPLRALRLYEFEWGLQPDAGNVDKPDVRKLIAEARVRQIAGVEAANRVGQ